MAVVGASKSNQGNWKGGGSQAVHENYKQVDDSASDNQATEALSDFDQTPPDDNAPGSPLRDTRRGSILPPLPQIDEYSQIEDARASSGVESGSGKKASPADEDEVQPSHDDYSQVKQTRKNEDAGDAGKSGVRKASIAR